MATREHSGFTLVELLVVLALAGIVMTLGVPSLRSSIESSRMTANANDLLGSLGYARSEAIKRGVRVTVCKIHAGNFTRCDTSGAWSEGWITFIDRNNGFSGSPSTVAPTTSNILKIHDALQAATLAGNGKLIDYLSFDGLGTMKFAANDSPANDGTDNFKLCPAGATSGSSGRTIVVNSVGRANVGRIPCP